MTLPSCSGLCLCLPSPYFDANHILVLANSAHIRNSGKLPVIMTTAWITAKHSPKSISISSAPIHLIITALVYIRTPMLIIANPPKTLATAISSWDLSDEENIGCSFRFRYEPHVTEDYHRIFSRNVFSVLHREEGLRFVAVAAMAYCSTTV